MGVTVASHGFVSPSTKRKAYDLPPPLPAAGLEAYLAERQRALVRDRRTLENYNKYTNSGRRQAKLDYLPIKLDIENVSRCNFRCRMCVVQDWPKGRRAKDLDFYAFKELVDEQYGLLEIKLQGIGEPLMQREPFFEMIRYARARHIWVRTTTNASLLHIKDNFRRLIDADVNELQISIDGATKDVFEHIRPGAVFSQIITNCAAVNQYCQSKSIERTKMWTVVQKANLHQLEALVDLAAELGFTNQVFSLELSDWGMDEWDKRNAGLAASEALDEQRLKALVVRGQALGVRVQFWTVAEKYRLGAPETLCPWPFERAYISSDSRVVPCCYIGNPDVSQIDSSIKPGHTFSDIWFGSAFNDFRQAHLDGRLPKICTGCYERAAET